jgi:hypothetical protein
MDDQGRHVFHDLDGNVLESWQVPLGDYLEAWKGSGDDRVRVHRTVVAKALAEGKPVDPSIVGEHDQALLNEEVAFLRTVLKQREERAPKEGAEAA